MGEEEQEKKNAEKNRTKVPVHVFVVLYIYSPLLEEFCIYFPFAARYLYQDALAPSWTPGNAKRYLYMKYTQALVHDA